MAMLLKLLDLGSTDRDVWLYDTFEGMPKPSEIDRSPDGSALKAWERAKARGERVWPHLFAPEVFDADGVRELLFCTGYPEARLHLVQGLVEDTVPAQAPGEIALLRLDTDWYESTRHELAHLYPRLVAGGVLIIDDYGAWEGCRRAVDEYFAEQPLDLYPVDDTGRLAVKR